MGWGSCRPPIHHQQSEKLVFSECDGVNSGSPSGSGVKRSVTCVLSGGDLVDHSSQLWGSGAAERINGMDLVVSSV